MNQFTKFVGMDVHKAGRSAATSRRRRARPLRSVLSDRGPASSIALYRDVTGRPVRRVAQPIHATLNFRAVDNDDPSGAVAPQSTPP